MSLVMKFGGTSVGKGMNKCTEITKEQQASQKWNGIIVVTSALTQVTNKLIKSADLATEGDGEAHVAHATAIRAQHLDMCREVSLGEEETTKVMAAVDEHLATFSSLCNAMKVLGECSPRGHDAISSLGERMSVVVLTAAMNRAGISAEAVDAKHLIRTDDQFQDARPDMEASTQQMQAKLQPMLDRGVVPVVTGFLGATKSGATTTLGRGGSDYSAAIVAACMDAEQLWVWTDVNGIMSADPRIVPDAVTIPRLSLREVAEMAYFGAKVLHPKTIRPVVDKGIPLRICNTFEAAHPGTMVQGDGTGRQRMASFENLALLEPEENHDGGYKAVTAIDKITLVTIAGRGMLGVVGVAARALAAVSDTSTSVPLITQASSEQSICLAVPCAAADTVVNHLREIFAVELRTNDIDSITASEECAILTVVGSEMVHTVGVAGQVFTALGKARVNVMAIAQGSSEVSISAVVAMEDIKRAVLALHQCTTVSPCASPQLSPAVGGPI